MGSTYETITLPRLENSSWAHSPHPDGEGLWPSATLLSDCGDLNRAAGSVLEAAARTTVWTATDDNWIHPQLLHLRTSEHFRPPEKRGAYTLQRGSSENSVEQWLGTKLLQQPFCAQCAEGALSKHCVTHSSVVNYCVDNGIFDLIETLNVEYGIHTIYSCEGHLRYDRQHNTWAKIGYISFEKRHIRRVKKLFRRTLAGAEQDAAGRAVAKALDNPEPSWVEHPHKYWAGTLGPYNSCVGKRFGQSVALDSATLNILTEQLCR